MTAQDIVAGYSWKATRARWPAGAVTAPERSDRPTERDQVTAGRGGHRDHAGEALDVVRGRAVVPDDRARPGRGEGARRVAAVGPEHEAASALDEGCVEARGALGPASVVLDHQPRPGAACPELKPGAHLGALDRVPARRWHERPYRCRATSSSGLRSARRIHSSGGRASGSRGRAE
jgi:hypothetical protein